MLALLALVQAFAVYLLDIPAYYPRGSEKPEFDAGVKEAQRLLHVIERSEPGEVHWTETITSNHHCERGYFNGPNYVKTAEGQAYWVTGTASADTATLQREHEALLDGWGRRYKNVGPLAEDEAMTVADAESPRSSTIYHLGLTLRDGTLKITVAVPGCYDSNHHQI